MANPKKAQKIGLGQFRRQGVAHNTQPGSAADLLSQKIADQRMQEWLCGKSETALVEASKGKAKGKRKGKGKGKNATEEEKTGGDSPAGAGKDGTPASNGEQKGQEAAAAAAKNDTTQKDKQDSVSTAATAPIRKLNQTGTHISSRRLTASSGPWGKQIVESAKKAAPAATATAYEDVTTMAAIKAAARALAATAESQRQSQIASQRNIPIRSIVQFEFAPTKTAGKSAIGASSSKKKKDKVQLPMWSDDEEDDDNDQDDSENIILSSRSTKPNPRTTRRQTTTSSSTNVKTALSGKKKGHRVQSTLQRRTLQFAASAASPTEGDDKINKPSLPHKSSKPAAKKQIPRMSAPSTFNPSSNDSSSNSDSNINEPTTPLQSPSPPNQNLDLGELSDDENSESFKDLANSPSKPIHPPIPQYQPPPPRPAPSPKETPPKHQRPDPSRKKGVARKPEPKRSQADDHDEDAESESDTQTKKRTARKRKRAVSSSSSSSSSPSDNDNDNDGSESGEVTSPASKKAKPSNAEKPQPQQQTPRKNGPPRKKGIASKPVQRKRAPQY